MQPVVIRRFAELDALSRAAAADFATIATEAIAERGVCHIALGKSANRVTAAGQSFEQAFLRQPHQG